jgi:3'-5' exonuclease
MSQIFVDIETQRTDDPTVIRRLQAAVKPPGQYKKPDSIAKWMSEEGASARVEAVAKTALDGTYGRLATIGFAADDDAPIILSGKTLTEVEMLTKFAAELHELSRIGSVPEMVAFNGEFDFRFLMKRYVINSLPVPMTIRRALNARDGYFDPMRAWEGFKGYISQQELEYALDIVRDDNLDGSEVGEAIDAGDWDRVVKHNAEDIQCLREIYKRVTA